MCLEKILMEESAMARKTALSQAAKTLGAKGGLKGGPARARVLSKSERSAIASKGGKAKAKKN